MQDTWWRKEAEEIEDAPNVYNTRVLCTLPCEVYEPTLAHMEKGVLLKELKDTLKQREEHFNEFLNGLSVAEEKKY